MSEVERTVEVTYRRADEADLPRLFAVFRASLNAYLVPAGQTGIAEEDDVSRRIATTCATTVSGSGWQRRSSRS